MSRNHIARITGFCSTAIVLAMTAFPYEMFAAEKPNEGPARLSSNSSAASLRAAIKDLSTLFGSRYAKSTEFVMRLDAIEPQLLVTDVDARTKAEADFTTLRRDALLANPLISNQPIVFVVRRQYTQGHHNTETFFPNAEREFNSGRFTPGAALKIIDFAKGGVVTTLIELPDGVLRDPEIHFTGKKIVFSMRKNTTDSYHIYEINSDGSGLKQLTFAKDVDDLDPLFLPDNSIAFSSTREPKYCGCNRHIMANLHRMEADGSNIQQIGKSPLFEGHGTLMPDGRILYDRWEYVDRNFGDAQGLWTVNPDGTNHAVYWGNNTGSPGAVLDARVIPGTERVICTFSSCHDRPWGALAIVDPYLSLDGPAGVTHIWPAEAMKWVNIRGNFDDFTKVTLKYEDPYPLSDKYFLCSRMTGQADQMGIYLLDIFGNEILLHTEQTEVGGCYDPMPLRAHSRPKVIPARLDLTHKEGSFYVQDVYAGTHMQGVKRGSIKSLRVVEAPEKRFWTITAWEGQGSESPAMNWQNFENKRILGTVPVEADGSVYVTVPADTFVFFQLLDEKGMMVQSMRSGTIVRPGETASCIGCHEDRSKTATAQEGVALALRRPPSQLEGWHGMPQLFSYMKEVQPVFDRTCVQCHDFGGTAAHKLLLARDRDLVFNVSYNELWRKGYIHAIGAGPPETQPAYSWGAHASKMVSAMIKCGEKHGLTDEEIDRVITWIDLNAPYYPSYASAHPDNLAGRSPLDDRQLKRLEALTGVPFDKLGTHSENRGPQISFDRPELSPCLSSIKNKSDPLYAEALAIILTGQQELAKNPEPDTDGFTPCETDQWRDRKYEARRAAELRNRDAILKGQRLHEN